MVQRDGLAEPPGRLGSLLKYAGLSREELASRVQVGTDSVNNWCSGRTLVSLPHLSRVVAVLRDAGVPADALSHLVTAELSRHGMAADVMDLVGLGDARIHDRPILVIGSHLYAESLQSVALGFREAMASRGIHNVVYLDTCARREVLEYYVTVTLRSSARGVVLVGLPLGQYELREVAVRLATRRIPSVFVHVGPLEPPPCSAVIRADNQRAATLATEILWSRGHRHIAAIGMAQWVTQDEKVQGYCDAIEQADGKPHVVWTQAPDAGPRPTAVADRPDLREAAEMVAADTSVTAILALSSQATKETMRALRNRHRVPGKDVSLVALGCWDWMHDVSVPPITHVALPYFRAGQEAARLIQILSVRELAVWERNVVASLPTEELHAGQGGTLTTLSSVPAASRSAS